MMKTPEDLSSFNKIQIVGLSGSGKTTLARKLSDELGIAHYEMDSIYIGKNWEIKDTETFSAEVAEIIKQDSWILCGAYITKLDGMTVRAADVIIYLNYPIRVAFSRMLRRTFRRVFLKEKIFNGNQESLVNFFFRPSKSLLYANLKVYFKSGRNHARKKLERYGVLDKTVIVRSPKELSRLLSKWGIDA